MAEKVELESAIGALEKALEVLKGAGGGAAFVQTEKWANTVSDVVSKMSQASASLKMSDEQMSLLSQLSDASKYSPQSATITGILSDMYTTFSKNLQTSNADEAKAHRNYEDLMATKEKQLNTLQESLVSKEAKKAEDEIQLADATQTYADSEEQLKSEIELFDATKKSCTQKTDDWSKRSTARTSELDGIKKALEILTSDESKELFAKSIKPGASKGAAASFIQMASVSPHSVAGSSKDKALHALEQHAKKTHSFRLAALAADVRMQTSGHFDKVIQSIDKLIAALDKEEAADIKKVDACKEEYQDISLKQNDLNWKIENNDAKIQKHKKASEEATAAKKVVIDDIADAVAKLEKMEKDRKAENEAFIQAKADDEKAIKVLGEAKAALTVYMKDNAFLQQEPDAKFSKNNAAKGQTNGVLALLDLISEDLENEIKEGQKAEAAAQTDYEAMKKSVEGQKAALEKTEINLKGQIAQEDTAKTDEGKLKDDNSKDLETQDTTLVNAKKTCDDAIKLQPQRREKRQTEADGLKEARSFLAGMEADALIQAPASKENVLPSFETLSFLQRRA